MPLDYLGAVFFQQTHEIPYLEQIKLTLPPLVLAILLKLYTNGSTNTWERKLHGKVYIVTGGTSGIGAALVREMASRGAQLVLLTSQIGEDSENSGKLWMTDYINDLREVTGNEMIYAEYCDLSSLYSIRKFATRWLDNKPARRLDGVICLAGETLPIGKLRTNSIDGVEIQMAVNYLSHYHLLTLLAPALNVQPPDRDVRVILSSCLSQNMGDIEVQDLLWEERNYPVNKPWKVFGTSKLLLNMFSKEFQRQLTSYQRPDNQPCGVRVNIINPGIVRSPGTRRFLTMGSIFGLFLYILLYPIFWLFLKSSEQGMQSYLFGINSPVPYNGKGGHYIKECSILENEGRHELYDEGLQKKVFEITKDKIEHLERASALERNKGKKKTATKKETKVNATASNDNVKQQQELENAKIGLFKSAFEGSDANPLFPDVSKLDEMDQNKQQRLRRLDAKYEKSRKT